MTSRSRDKSGPDYEPRMEDLEATQLASVELMEMRLGAFSFALRGIPQYEQDSDEIRNAIRIISGSLYKSLADAHRRLFMTALFSLNPEFKDKVKKMAFKKYLEEGKGIMHLLDVDGRSPTRYYTEVEKRFRHMMESTL